MTDSHSIQAGYNLCVWLKVAARAVAEHATDLQR